MYSARVPCGLAGDRLGWLPPPETNFIPISNPAFAQRTALPFRQLLRCNISMQKPQRRVLGSQGWAGLDTGTPSSSAGSPSSEDSTSPGFGTPCDDDSGCSKAEMMQLVSMLPFLVRNTLQDHPQMESLVEIVMDLGRVPFARFATDEAPLSSQAVTESDLEEAVLRVSYPESTPCHAPL